MMLWQTKQSRFDHRTTDRMGRKLPQTNEDYIEVIYEVCMNFWAQTWIVADFFTLVTGVLANAVLLLLFLRERKTLSASQVIGMNLVLMNLTYLIIIPVNLISRLVPRSNATTLAVPGNQTDTSAHFSARHIRKIFNYFILIGTPLLLTCMCVERHLAVSRPVLYMKTKERKYRVMASAVVWALTLGFCSVSVVVNQTLLMIAVSITVSSLFVLMLFCLGTMVRSLWQPSPALRGNGAHPESPRKRQAIRSLLVVVVSAVSVYLPVLALFPVVLYVYYHRKLPFALPAVCDVFECTLLFPCFGVLIGPLFFFSKARQMFKFKTTNGPG